MNSIELKHVSKTYETGKLKVPVLKGVDIAVASQELVAIMGPSGSGKSTLMNLMGLLDRPSSGEVVIGGQPVTLTMSDQTLARIRSEKIGFVFQSFHLLPRLTALGNVLMPTSYRHEGRKDRVWRAKQLLKQLGIGKRADHLPAELSGGEKQRVAIARALINNPEIILADEPTGNLDSASGREVMQILKDLRDEGKAVVIITHDPAIAAYCERTIHILDGRVSGGMKGGKYVR